MSPYNKLLPLVTALSIIFSGLFSTVSAYTDDVRKNYDIANKYVCVRKMNLFFDRPILFSFGDTFLHSFPSVAKFSCDMTVSSRSKQTGIIASMQQLKLRMTNPTTCYDWIKFDRDSTLRCGDVQFGNRLLQDGSYPPPPRYVSLYSGPFLLGTSWSESFDMVSKMDIVQPDKNLITYFNIDAKALQPGEDLKIIIAYTGFKECDADNVPRGWFNCGYGVCIMEKLVYDGVVNCPFGDCIDEGSCEDAILQFNQVTGVFNESTSVGGAISESRRRKPPMRGDSDDSMCQMSSMVQLGRGGLLACNSSMNDVKHIKDEFERHNTIFERVSNYIEHALNKIELNKTKPWN